MVNIARTRLVNPRLGTYFGIFAAAFATLVLLALMFEQLGTSDDYLRVIMYAGPIALFAAIGLMAATRDPADFFACGRRVPAFFNGLVLGVCAIGGTGYLALTGSILIIGVDAMCLSIGIYAGLVFMAVLLAPFLRKVGAYTVPSYLGRRFESRALRIVSAAILSVPILLLLAAEARFAAYASAWLTGLSDRLMALVVVVCATVIVIAGGMRSLTWASAAKAIAALLSLAVPATIVAVMVSNLPLPQMTHGSIVRGLMRLEIARDVPTIIAPALAFDFPGEGVVPFSKRFIETFDSVGSLSFILTMFVVAAGIASSPVLLARSGTTPGVYEARKSLGWAVLVAGFVALTLPAIAAYLRGMLVDQVVGQVGDRLPIWFQLLQQAGIARIDSKREVVTLAGLYFERDAALFSLPIAAGFPQALVYLSIAGALAAALAGLTAALVAVSAILAEDVVHGLPDESVSDGARVGTARLTLLGAAFVTVWLAIAAPADPLQLFLWSLTLSASASFPVLVLSIWWKRCNGWGATAGMFAGFGMAALVMLLCETGALGMPSVLAAVFGLPTALAATLIVSRMTPVPAPAIIELAHELRVPGGETLYDRELRLLRLKSRPPG